MDRPVGLRMAHVGVVCTPPNLTNTVKSYERLGYEKVMEVRRSDPWIGEITGIPGADIEIVHLRRKGEQVGIEVLAYHSPSPGLGTHHIAYWADDGWEMPTGWVKRGEAVIPEGPNRGVRAAYYEGWCFDIVEVMWKP